MIGFWIIYCTFAASFGFGCFLNEEKNPLSYGILSAIIAPLIIGLAVGDWCYDRMADIAEEDAGE